MKSSRRTEAPISMRPLIFILCALVATLSSGSVGLAAMGGLTQNPMNVICTGMLGAPASLSAIVSGANVELAWPASSDASGYRVERFNNGTSSSCASSWTLLSNTASTTLTDTGRSTPQGTYECYRVLGTYQSWTSLSAIPTAAAQIGVVATSVSLVNAGNTSGCSGSGSQQFGQSGKLDCGDQVIINFNQPISTTTGPSGTHTICPSQVLLLASTTTSGGCGIALVQTGSYAGNSTDDRNITGVGFQPDVVIVKAANTTSGVVRTSTMPSDRSKDMVDVSGLSLNRIQGFHSDGFQVGTNSRVNESGTTYHWIAMKGSPGEMVLGTYTGNGADNRNITGLGFTPDWVMTVPENIWDPDLRWTEFATDNSIQMHGSTGFESDHIQSLFSGGFQVGTAPEQNENGVTYHYVAWKKISGRYTSGTYTGTGNDNRNINTPGFLPELVTVFSPDAQTHYFRTASQSGDFAIQIGDQGGSSNTIQNLQANGFQVGNDAAVNQSDYPYYWTAWKESLPSTATSPGETVTLGVLSGGSIAACNCRFSATYAWSNNNKTLTITIGAMSVGSIYPTISGSFTLNPTTDTSKIKSTTESLHICDTNSGGGNCLPVATGTF